MNTDILDNREYAKKISQFWTHWQSRKLAFRDLNAWWDIGKKKIKHISIAFSKKLARANRSKRRDLEQKLFDVIKLDAKNHMKSAVENIKDEIRALDNKAVKGAKIRSKDRFYSEYEKPSKYFYNLENSRQGNKVITALNTTSGRVTTHSDISEAAASFYENLYKSETTNPRDRSFLISSISKFLSDDEKEGLESELDVESCFAALKSMQNGKSPGSDGLPAEFYHCFWSTLGQDLVEVLNYSLIKGQLPESLRLALITLLFKKGDRLDLKNWRPISLLNVDYKIGAKTLANRLKMVLSSVLSEDQTCGVPGRSTFDNLRLVRVSNALTRMNLGPTFWRFITVLYTDVRSVVMNNGHKSREISLQRGVWQGCPLSPLLYSLVAGNPW